MKEKLKKYKLIQTIIFVLYFSFILLCGIKYVSILPKSIYDKELLEFYLGFSIILLIYLVVFYLINFFSIIWHELGHLIFGLKAKLKFISFNILSFTFYKENNKLKIKKEAKLPGILGYCNMTTDENIKYSEGKIKLYFFGGIIFNIIAAIISTVLYFIVGNAYLKLAMMFLIGNSIYFALNNATPAETKTGGSTDALHILYYKQDNNYIDVFSKITKLQKLLVSGTELKDIDPKLFNNPQTFKTGADILSATIYVDYLTSKEKYGEAKQYIEKILSDGKEILSKQNVITLKLQHIISIFYENKEMERIKDIWDDEISNYLKVVSKIDPIFIGLNYMYASLVENNKENAEKYLKQYQKINKKHFTNYQLEDAKKLFEEIDKRKNN